jgi:carbamoyl-phosphate synthase large subunit
VTGVGGCGVGEGIVKSLLLSDGPYRIVAANMHPAAPVLFRSHAAYLLPPASHPEYLDAVKALCCMQEIDALIPGSEPELYYLAQNAAAVSGWGVTLVANPWQVISTCRDKWRTAQFLQREGLGSIRTSLAPPPDQFLETVGFPVVVKPRSGHASQHVYVVQEPRELGIVLSYFAIKGIPPIVQECVGQPDQEFTVGAAFSPAKEPIGAIAMRRRLLGGFSQYVEVEEFPGLCSFGLRVGLRLGASGPLNIQCRADAGGFRVFEINPRFSGTAPFRAMAGFNEVDLLLRSFLGLGGRPAHPRVRFGLVGMRGLEEVLLPRETVDALPRPCPTCC